MLFLRYVTLGGVGGPKYLIFVEGRMGVQNDERLCYKCNYCMTPLGVNYITSSHLLDRPLTVLLCCLKKTLDFVLFHIRLIPLICDIKATYLLHLLNRTCI